MPSHVPRSLTAGSTLFLLLVSCLVTSLSYFPPQGLTSPGGGGGGWGAPPSFSPDPERQYGPKAVFLTTYLYSTVFLVSISPDVLITEILSGTEGRKEGRKQEELATSSLMQTPQRIIKSSPGVAVAGLCQIHPS